MGSTMKEAIFSHTEAVWGAGEFNNQVIENVNPAASYKTKVLVEYLIVQDWSGIVIRICMITSYSKCKAALGFNSPVIKEHQKTDYAVRQI